MPSDSGFLQSCNCMNDTTCHARLSCNHVNFQKKWIPWSAPWLSMPELPTILQVSNPELFTSSSAISYPAVILSRVNNPWPREHPTKYLHILSTEQCLASSELLTPPPLHPASVSSPPATKAGSTFRKTPDIGLASCSIIPLRSSYGKDSSTWMIC